MPAPAEYRLGPGDKILISMWGEINFQETFTIDRKGMIYYPKIGFISIANNTLDSAEKILIEEFSKIFSSLNDEEYKSSLMLTLGELKSINIYFSGNIENPGINLVHPFSDIFTAIVQAGGVTKDGTLREIQLIRNGEIIDSVDFYSFFLDGKKIFPV